MDVDHVPLLCRNKYDRSKFWAFKRSEANCLVGDKICIYRVITGLVMYVPLDEAIKIYNENSKECYPNFTYTFESQRQKIMANGVGSVFIISDNEAADLLGIEIPIHCALRRKTLFVKFGTALEILRTNICFKYEHEMHIKLGRVLPIIWDLWAILYDCCNEKKKEKEDKVESNESVHSAISNGNGEQLNGNGEQLYPVHSRLCGKVYFLNSHDCKEFIKFECMALVYVMTSPQSVSVIDRDQFNDALKQQKKLLHRYMINNL